MTLVEDCILIQQDLGSFYSSYMMNHIKLNTEKCDYVFLSKPIITLSKAV